jgi:hypothetical protein
VDAYNSTELALPKWPAVRIQIHMKSDHLLRAREPAQKVRISVNANDGAAELRQIDRVSSPAAP